MQRLNFIYLIEFKFKKTNTTNGRFTRMDSQGQLEYHCLWYLEQMN